MDAVKPLLLVVLALIGTACGGTRDATTSLPIPVMVALQQAQQDALGRAQVLAQAPDASVSPESLRAAIDAAFGEPRRLVADDPARRAVVEALIEVFHRTAAAGLRLAVARQRFLDADANWPTDLDAVRALDAEADRFLHETAAFRAFLARHPDDTQRLLARVRADPEFAQGVLRGMRQGGDPTARPAFVATTAYAEAVRARCRVLLTAPDGWRFDRGNPGHPDSSAPAALREAFAAAVRTARGRYAELVVATADPHVDAATP